jgi:hypothetical protein
MSAMDKPLVKEVISLPGSDSLLGSTPPAEKQKLLGISKRGNPYLRRLFAQGARAVLQVRDKQEPGLRRWLEQLAGRRHVHVAAIALANEMARISWAVLASQQRYQPSTVDAFAARFPHLQPSDGGLIWIMNPPGLLANNEIAKRSIPALWKPMV